ncbi:hypothetical protein [Terrabacter terrigena]|uniref:Transcription factor zinc-finger domain-containing protein n=1 Tax=Terrabacter terrigena TaxID=574718 RepID=A0ABW3MZX5_9MICO
MNDQAVCPGDCNRAWRKAQAFSDERDQLLAAQKERNLTSIEQGRLLRLSIEPMLGDPVWCTDCLDAIKGAVRRLPDLAAWLWDRGHAGAGIDLGRLSTVRAERGSSTKGSPSLSPSWDACDEIVTWAAAVEDKVRARLGIEARDGDWWNGTSEHRATVLSTSVWWILARPVTWSLPEAERWGLEVQRLAKRAEKLSGRDELVHHLGACPHCDRRALIRIDGEDVVHCERCRRRWTEDEYQWLVRVAVAAAKDQKTAKA